MQQHDLDPIGSESAQARVEASSHAVGAEVPYPPLRHGHVEAIRQIGSALGRGLEQTPHLCGQYVLLAPPIRESVGEPTLGETEPVVRRGVEVADAGSPG